jgi:hypothetical protein
MNLLRFLVVVMGFPLPFLARLPLGIPWLRQYTDCSGLDGILFLTGFQSVPVAALFALSFVFRTPRAWLLPVGAGFSYLAWHHARLDLAADAQSAIALVLIPIYSLLPIGIAGIVGYAIESFLSKGGPGRLNPSHSGLPSGSETPR